MDIAIIAKNEKVSAFTQNGKSTRMGATSTDSTVCDSGCMLDMRAEFARTELGLGFTFLRAASLLSDAKRVQKCVQDAIVALRTVNRFLARDGDGEYADIRRGRDELRGRLREVMREHTPYSTKPFDAA